ncbi:mitochondrial ribosomal subunit protein-domain-containing protein [Clohesyomyces aquaticus]|uniref:Mitochondrial ribosomal subunit protein-domain-containing protein n=1 Tax=Clohesyomyces aquaticus TaxID=1231657 RepID=A0A1Y1Y0Z5_9PLEO|nr:mitochondrial ribosomal subunit protein-domain-containing protein [Clohesyomyces aquaticus]
MASISRRILFHSTRSSHCVRPRCPNPKHNIQWQQRPLSSTRRRFADDEERTPRSAPVSEHPQHIPRPANLTEDQERRLQIETLIRDLEREAPDVQKQAQARGDYGAPWQDNFKMTKDEDFETISETGRKDGFWAEGEPTMGPDEDFYGDDLTSHGHGELQQHRELRHYARMAAWELPLLSQLARPFELPTAKTPFRFRYTSYLGDSHPSVNKVVVEFSASDIPLSPVQKSKLIKLSGPRYNPSTDIIKLSCELYDTQDQNKRWLGDKISVLLAEVKDSKDTFEDVPFDFRHHKPKVRYEFPKEWILTPERKKYLEERRERMQKLDYEKEQNGELVDGVKVIEQALPYVLPTVEPVTVPAPRARR